MIRYESSTKDIILTGMFAAVLTVLSQIQIPMPSGVPVTLQTFAIAFTGFVLGWRKGLITVAVYILLGVIGLPVFTGFMGGIGKIAGLTGGFIWGFLFLVSACGAGNRMSSSMRSGVGSKLREIVQTAVVAGTGLLICHFFGTLQFMMLSETSFQEAALLVSVPYLPKDAVSLVAAWLVSRSIRKRLNEAGITI